MPAQLLSVTAQELELDMSPEAFGMLKDSSEIMHDPLRLQAAMREDGYLFLRGLLDREEVLAARQTSVSKLSAAGMLAEQSDPMDAVYRKREYGPPDMVKDNAELHRVLYSGAMIRLFEGFLGGPVKHFDFTWFRSVAPGRGTPPHCDVVYMGRGTSNLFTAWTPLGDITLEQGGLIILENSHKLEIIQPYRERDVDTYCLNGRQAAEIESGRRLWEWNGSLSKNPRTLREKLGGRWLTADEFRAGDVLIFGMRTVHASLDNQSDAYRLSSDSRYQLASEPADERWVGANPVGHGVGGKRGRIC